MKLYIYPESNQYAEIIQRPVENSSAIEKQVRKILKKVNNKGDKAIRKFIKNFDGISIDNLAVTDQEFLDADALLSDELKAAIQQAKKNIELFHSTQKIAFNKIETMPGVECWQKTVAIDKVGLYIPGGSAPLFSTVLMLAIPAAIAGCSEIILCSPPDKKGNIHPAILYTAKQCGISKIFKAGGAHAIAAMAFGTDTIPAVYKIFGPGNQFVTMAKQLLQQTVAIDMPAGPSEVLVIADDSAAPEFVAADLLSQAEHGADSQVILLCTSEQLIDNIKISINSQLNLLPRKEIAEKALQNSKIVLLKDIAAAIEISNHYAPEHLILSIENANDYLDQISNAGSVFIGAFSAESIGDYASGPNHTLPTNGFAKMYSGVSVSSFEKKISFQKITEDGLLAIGKTVMEMAAAEGLEAHKNAVAIRLQTLNK